MLARMWSKGNTHPQLVIVQIFTATVKISVALPQDDDNQATTQCSYTPLWPVPKDTLFCHRETWSTIFLDNTFITGNSIYACQWKNKLRKCCIFKQKDICYSPIDKYIYTSHWILKICACPHLELHSCELEFLLERTLNDAR